MAVIDRSDLEASPLADLHAIAGQIGLDGFRRLRKAELIDTILERRGGDGGGAVAQRKEAQDAEGGHYEGETQGGEAQSGEPEGGPTSGGDGGESRGRGGRGQAGRGSRGGDGDRESGTGGQERQRRRRQSRGERRHGENAEGSGDRGSSHGRSARARGEGADSGGESAGDRSSEPDAYEGLPAGFPDERLKLESTDPTLQVIDSLTPFGLGSRVVIVGAQLSGKTETLHSLVGVLAGRESLQVKVLLLGVRPEEVSEWRRLGSEPVAALDIAAGAESQTRALEQAVSGAKAAAVAGANVVLAVDSLEGLRPPVARRALVAARNIPGSGSVTLLATAARPFGGETTVIALDGLRVDTGTPALNPLRSGTIKAELLVGEQEAAELRKARAQATDQAGRSQTHLR